jgi:hypothetical protein
MSNFGHTKINAGKLGGRRVRIVRPYRGYPVGTVLSPPAGARQIMLQDRDALGRPVAEIVNDDQVEAINEPSQTASEPAPVAKKSAPKKK